MEIADCSEKALQDYDIVQQAAKGDEKAFRKLMSRYRNSIYYMMLKMVGNKNDAEDLTIEAFTKAFQNIKNFQPHYAFSTWLFKIASNNGIDFIRKQRKQITTVETQDQDSHPLAPLAEDPDPADKMIKQQTNDIVRNVVKRLKPSYRRLVELRYFQEFTYEEIAAELDIPLGTVKAQLNRSRDLLYNLLKNTGAEKEI